MKKQISKKASYAKTSHGSSSLFWFIVLVILLPLVVWGVYQNTHSRSKASSRILSPWGVPDVDYQTGEYYDLQVDIPSVVTTINSGSGFLYLANTTINLYGTRISNYTQPLYGFIQSPQNEETKQILFSYKGESYPRFTSDAVILAYSNCIDIHSSAARTQADYIATFCYNLSFPTPGTASVRAYSPNANPWIEYTYTGTKVTTLIILSTAFNKYANNPPYNGANNHWSRVNYFTIDSQSSTLNNFTNLKYHIAALISGLTQEQYNNICILSSSYPKKYLKQTWDVKPEGGSNSEITISAGQCNFEYDSTYLLPSYISLDIDGGIPYPSPTPGPTSSPTPTATPTPTPTPTPIPNSAPTILNTLLPYGKVGTRYGVKISGTDSNTSDILTPIISSLPPGISRGSCSQYVVGTVKQIDCRISGIPTKVGVYSIVFSLRDNKGGSVQQKLPLVITN